MPIFRQTYATMMMPATMTLDTMAQMTRFMAWQTRTMLDLGSRLRDAARPADTTPSDPAETAPSDPADPASLRPVDGTLTAARDIAAMPDPAGDVSSKVADLVDDATDGALDGKALGDAAPRGAAFVPG